MNEKTQALYRELGPALFARAKRVLRDEAAAEKLVLEVVAEVAKLGDLPAAELAKRARNLVKDRCEAQHVGSIFDSVQPGTKPRG